jgi:hypothetical protein
VPKWRNWQTRMVQVHVLARVWGFESLLRHQQILLQTLLTTAPNSRHCRVRTLARREFPAHWRTRLPAIRTTRARRQAAAHLIPSNEMADGKEHAVGHLL